MEKYIPKFLRKFIFPKQNKESRDCNSPGTAPSELMTEDKFWKIIAKSQRGRKLENCLKPLSEPELFGFKYWWDYYCHLSYTQELWAVAYVVLGGCSDDSFDYFRYWLIAQGEKTVKKALENADSLCDVFTNLDDPESKDYPEQEELNYVVQDVLAERTGDDEYFYSHEEAYSLPRYSDDIELEWNEDDEDSIRKMCPRTFAKWWNNGPF